MFGSEKSTVNAFGGHCFVLPRTGTVLVKDKVTPLIWRKI
jgi:hypothetical protein